MENSQRNANLAERNCLPSWRRVTGDWRENYFSQLRSFSASKLPEKDYALWKVLMYLIIPCLSDEFFGINKGT